MQKDGIFSLYFVGIGGISMSALALFLHRRGFNVSGYDRVISPITDELQKQGIVINDNSKMLTCDLAVVSSAINESDQQIVRLKKLGKPFITRSRLLWEIASTYPQRVGVAGTHGKTTATAIISHIFKSASKDFCAHIGGLDKVLGNLYGNGKEVFISEVCEYKKNVANFNATVALLLNVEDDHLESYGNINNLYQEFSAYLSRANVPVVVYEQKQLCLEGGITFSLNNSNADYYASDIRVCDEGLEFIVNRPIGARFKVKLNSFYPHDVTNCLGAIAVCEVFKIKEEQIIKGISEFKGIYRRQEIMGRINGCTIFADYAHHPSQIKNCVKMLESRYPKFALFFQSHTYSRTSRLFKEFKSVLSPISNLFLYDTYGAREKYDYQGSAKRLCENIGGCVYAGDKENAPAILNAISKDYDCIAIVGAGDLYDEIKNKVKFT